MHDELLIESLTNWGDRLLELSVEACEVWNKVIFWWHPHTSTLSSYRYHWWQRNLSRRRILSFQGLPLVIEYMESLVHHIINIQDIRLVVDQCHDVWLEDQGTSPV
jgi:hypothetical protein